MDHHVSNWDARHMRRPDAEPILQVTGECALPATYRAVLKVAEEQGDDPSQLVLDLIINDPSGLPPQGVELRATLNITFKMPTLEPYTSIKIVDVYADPDTTEETTWVLPIKQVDWSTTARPAESQRWKGKATAHREH